MPPDILLPPLPLHVEEFGPQELCTLLWALATLRLHPGPAWLEAWTSACLPRLPAFSPRDLTQTLWALATLRYHREGHGRNSSSSCGGGGGGDATWALAALSRAAATARGFSARDLANLLWACARLSLLDDLSVLGGPGADATTSSSSSSSSSSSVMHQSREFDGGSSGGGGMTASWWLSTMLAPLAASEVALSRVKPRDAAEMLWALGRIGQRPPPRLLHALLWRFTSCGPPPLPAAGGSSSSSSSHTPGQPPPSQQLCVQDVANVCWALAVLRFQPHGSLREGLVAMATWVAEVGFERPGYNSLKGGPQFVSQVEAGDPSAAAKDAWHGREDDVHQGRGRASVADDGAFLMIGADVGLALPVVLWSLTRLGWAADAPMLMAAAARAAAASSATELSPQGASMMLYCFARAGYRPRPVLLARLLARLCPEGDSDGVPSSASATTTAPIRALAASEAAAAVAAGNLREGRHGGGIRAQTAAIVLWSLGKLRFCPPDAWTRRLLVHTVHLLPRASPGELCNLAKGLAMLRFRPDALWAGVFSDCLSKQLLRGRTRGNKPVVVAKQLESPPGAEGLRRPPMGERPPLGGAARGDQAALHAMQLQGLLWALPCMGMAPRVVSAAARAGPVDPHTAAARAGLVGPDTAALIPATVAEGGGDVSSWSRRLQAQLWEDLQREVVEGDAAVD